MTGSSWFCRVVANWAKIKLDAVQVILFFYSSMEEWEYQCGKPHACEQNYIPFQRRYAQQYKQGNSRKNAGWFFCKIMHGS
jgi:hypothetical protein